LTLDVDRFWTANDR